MIVGIEQARDTMDFRGLDRFLQRHRRHDVAMRFASIDLPVPGGPIIRTLWPPATATSIARLT